MLLNPAARREARFAMPALLVILDQYPSYNYLLTLYSAKARATSN